MPEMRELAIAYGASRQAKTWVNKQISFGALKDRLKVTQRTPESAEEYAKMDKAARDQAKDLGGFVGGTLIGGRRKVDSVQSRSMISLDGDRITSEFLDAFEKNMPFAAFLYTTHSSTKERPRVRIVVPLTRDVSPEEFVAVSRYLAQMLGIDQPGFISGITGCTFDQVTLCVPARMGDCFNQMPFFGSNGSV